MKKQPKLKNPTVSQLDVWRVEQARKEFMANPAFQTLGNAFMNGAAVAFGAALVALKGKP